MQNTGFLNKLESINDQLNLTHYWIIFLKYKRIIHFSTNFIWRIGFVYSLKY